MYVLRTKEGSCDTRVVDACCATHPLAVFPSSSCRASRTGIWWGACTAACALLSGQHVHCNAKKLYGVFFDNGNDGGGSAEGSLPIS